MDYLRRDYHGNRLNFEDKVKLKNPLQYGIKEDKIYTICYFYDTENRAELIEVGDSSWLIVKCNEVVKVGE